MTARLFNLLLLFNILFCGDVEANFFGEKNSGWHWYKDPEKFEPNVPHGTAQNIDVKSSSDVVSAYKKELETRLHMAWVDPSFKNIRAYQELQKDMMDRAENFSEMWMKVLYHSPHLDHTLITPVNHKSRHLYFDQKKEDIKETIQNLANDYGLLFFFDSRCRYCQEFSPIVQLFSKLYHWEVMPISADGGNLKEFLNPLSDNGIINQWKIEAFPALFAVNPNTSHVMPIAYGMTSLDEIESRILLLEKVGGIKP